MKASLRVTFLGVFLFAIALSQAQEKSLQEKIRDVSPDKKFAVRISYDPTIDDGSDESLSSDAIRSINVVTLPDKTEVGSLSRGEGGLEGKFIWSSDSKWLAYAVSEGHRVTETNVYHWKGDKFEPLNTEEIGVDPGGDARNQYITPLRWLKPGTLVLKQFTIFSKGAGESTIEFSVHFDADGKFHVINRKKVRSKDE